MLKDILMYTLLPILSSMLIYGVILFATFGGLWKLFVKAGLPGWHALIPLYSVWQLDTICTGRGITAALCLTPLAPVYMLYLFYMVSKAFNANGVMTWITVLMPTIAFPILGFGKAEYMGPQAWEPADNLYNKFVVMVNEAGNVDV